MNRFLTFIGAVSLLATSATVTANCDPGETVIKFSHVVEASGHPKGEAAAAIAERVNSEMDGDACMQVFPRGQLFTDSQVMEALLLGDVHVAAPSLADLDAYSKRFRILELPFLFSDMNAVQAFVNGSQGQELLNAMEGRGYIGLSYIFNGLKHFSATQPLIVPTDAQGLKFRVQTSEVSEEMMNSLSANIQRLEFSQVYGALQTGVAEGQDNTWTNIFSQRLFEVQDGVTETNHQLLAYVAVTARDWLLSLPNDVREKFVTIFKEETQKANANAIEQANVAKEEIIKAGGVVRTLSPEQRQLWVDVVSPVWDKFSNQVGQDMIEAAVAAGR